MADILLILTMGAFFFVCALYVSWCDRIIGTDPEPATENELDVPELVRRVEAPT